MGCISIGDRSVIKFLSTIAAVTVLLAPGMARADSDTDAHASAWVTTPQTQVRLIAAGDATGTSGFVRLGLQFKLKDGWKIYWRRPGDAGFPPRLDWAEAENVSSADFGWPAPMRFQVLGFQTMGYTKEVVFPIVVKLTKPSEPLKAHVRLDYLTCDEVCIPYFAELSLDIAPGPSRPTEYADLIDTFAARIPGQGTTDGLSLDKIETSGLFRRLDASARSGAVRIHASSTTPFVHPDVFIEGPELAFFGAPEIRLTEEGRRAVLSVPVTLEENATLDAQQVRLTLVDGQRSTERNLTVEPGAVPLPPPATRRFSFLVILAFALLGGFILNFMPCVLPVLSLKIIAVVNQGRDGGSSIRASFLASASGIVASFLAIATVLMALKAAGAEVGWGIQFQNPWFVGALAAITLLFAANLIGLFVIPLPSWLAGLVSGRSDGNTGQRPTLAGDFATGAFATLMATPCSAPFLGTAIGFALAGSPSDVIAVFAAMGAGMAIPYLAVAILPQAARFLPRPGAWMNGLKKVLALGLVATSVWLMTIVAAQIGPDESSAYDARDALRAAKNHDNFWAPFDPTSIAELVADGKTVFVDITADWCITCQVNKAVVIERAPVRTLLQNKDVVAMRGDWTRPDSGIAAYLQSFGRYAIPFNAVYGPALPGGVALSELLGSAEVTGTLSRASGGTLAAAQQ